MKDIATGFLIIIIGIIIIDFVYTEKNTCNVSNNAYSYEYAKCGLLKKQFDINLNFLGRYW